MDKFTNQRKKKPKYELKTFYGQIQYIVHIPLPATEDLGLEEPVNVILATIKNCPIERENANLVCTYQNEDGYAEVVDITAIQCLVARVFDRGWWTIIE